MKQTYTGTGSGRGDLPGDDLGSGDPQRKGLPNFEPLLLNVGQSPTNVEQLKIATIVSVVLLLIGLGWLSRMGWTGWTKTVAEVDQLKAATLSTGAITATTTVTPTVTPTATEAVAPTMTPGPEAATFAAGQHFVTLAVLTATMVLFPWVLLLAFAFQRAPRLFRDLENDMEKLGLYGRPEKMRQDLEKTLTERIRSGLLPPTKNAPVKDYRQADESLAKASQYAQQLVSMALGRGTGPGTPSDVELPVLMEAIKQAEESSERIYEETIRFERGVSLIRERFGPGEFLLPLLSLTPIVLVSFIWAFWPQAMFGFVHQMKGDASLNEYFGKVVVQMAPAAVAVVTAYLFMAFQLARRYHRSDITPGAFWEVLKRLLVVFLLGLVGSILLGADGKPGADGNVLTQAVAIGTRAAAIAFGILAGIFPEGTLVTLVRAAQSWVQKKLSGNDIQVDLAQGLQQKHPLFFLDDLDQWEAERLIEEGIIGIQGMANADIDHLLIWTPFPTRQIVDWVDQAILFLAAGADPDIQYVKIFRQLGLRGASDLLDATRDEEGKRKVMAAAQALQKPPAEDPILLAEIAALRVQRQVKDAQEKVSKAKDKKENDPLDEETKKNITSAVSAVRDAKTLADQAVARVKAGDEMLAAALDAANSLQTKINTASEKANDVEKALASAQDKVVTADLAAKLKALWEALAGDQDANSQAQTLVDKITKPLAQTKATAKEFEEKSKKIQETAEKPQDKVPGAVAAAESLFNKFMELAKDAQKQIKADSNLADAIGSVNDLVKLLTDESADKPKKLLEALKKEDQWTAAGDGKAKSYSDAEKLVEQAGEILKQVQATAKAVEDARAAVKKVSVPPLTLEVLETILKGLERNANLRRIERYLTIEANEVESPGEYTPNNEWSQKKPKS